MVSCPTPPRWSFALNLRTYAPSRVYAWVAVPPVAPDPSPKSQVKVRGSPSGSEDPDASAVTVSGAGPVVGLADATATGAVLFPAIGVMRFTALVARDR